MKPSIIWLVATILFLTLVNCSKTDILEGVPVDIRVKNISPYDFDSVMIWDINLGPIESHGMSNYFTRDIGYDKASILIKIDSFQFGQTVIDYVGEKPLRKGRYTFEIDLSELSNEGYLSQNMVQD